MIPKLIQVKALPDYKIWVKYMDGFEGNYDLKHLKSKGVFQIFDDYDVFSKVYIDFQNNSIAWNEEVDICPNNVYLKLQNLTFEQWKNNNSTNA
ncbi:MAG: DUF2442 domain-containing protein [Bacteroidota bacterium]|nr:DUF2442 domain-containing protein [Bacteroidota bacterium]